MTILEKGDACFQCGNVRIIVKIYKEYINGSLVTTTQSVCSDQACQKRTEELIQREKARREEAAIIKLPFGRKEHSKK